MKRIDQCPLDIDQVHLFSTEDPDVIAEVRLYRTDVRISVVKAMIAEASRLEEIPVVVAPVTSPPDIKIAVDTHNQVFDRDRERVRDEKKRSQRLQDWIDRVEKEKRGKPINGR